MQLIHNHLHDFDPLLPKIAVNIDRLTLAKRRWRGVATDGAEFGFDLEHHLHDGDVVFQKGNVLYAIQQKPEPVFAVTLGTDSAAAARLGWMIGNLHFPLEVADGTVCVAEDSALRQLFEREHIPFVVTEKIFHPLFGAHHH